MPSWSVHLALANRINKKLDLGDEFVVGNVLPDVLEGYTIENPSQIVVKNVNHFLNGGKPKYIDVDAFVNKYKNNLNNPVILGYLCHLITDEFFNKYTFEHHIVLRDDKRVVVLKDGTILSELREKPWQIKQRDFSRFGQKLINDGMVNGVGNVDIKNISVIEECPINTVDLDKTIERINGFTVDNFYDKEAYEMFTEEELLKLYESCYKYILDKLKTLW